MPGLILRAAEVNRSYYWTEQVEGDLRETLGVNLAWLSLYGHIEPMERVKLWPASIQNPFQSPPLLLLIIPAGETDPPPQTKHGYGMNYSRAKEEMERRWRYAGFSRGKNSPGTVQASRRGSEGAVKRHLGKLSLGDTRQAICSEETKIPGTMSELLRAPQFTSSPSEPWWCRAKSSSKGFKGTEPPHKPKAVWFIKWPWERTHKGHSEELLCVNNGTSASLICPSSG